MSIFDAIKNCDVEEVRRCLKDTPAEIHKRTFRQFFKRRVCCDPLTYVCGEWGINNRIISNSDRLSKLVEIAKLLLENGADANIKVRDDGWTLLHYITKAHSDEYGCYAEYPDSMKGKFVNRFAMKSQFMAMVQLLIENGIDIAAKNNEGKTAFDFCSDPEMQAWMYSIYQQKEANEAVNNDPMLEW